LRRVHHVDKVASLRRWFGLTMQLTPAQIAVRLICGASLPGGRGDSLLERVRKGHGLLVQITGQDFGYHLQAWHDHLKISRQGGYTYGRHIALPGIMKAALASLDWQAAVRNPVVGTD
jgi:hypothetical protein